MYLLELKHFTNKLSYPYPLAYHSEESSARLIQYFDSNAGSRYPGWPNSGKTMPPP